MEELCKHLQYSKRFSIHNADENDFHGWDKFLSIILILLEKIKSNHIFSVTQQSWEMNFSGIKSRLVMSIKEIDLEDASVVDHNYIKQGFEIEK